MTVTGECENPPKKRPSASVAFLITSCLFLLLVCVVLICTLVIVGKFFVFNPYAGSERSFVGSLDGGAIKIKNYKYARLPSDTRPIRYNLTLFPDLETGTFRGIVNITATVRKTRENLVLHSKNLSIDKVEVKRFNDSKVIPITNITEDEFEEVVVLIPREKLLPGDYFIYFEFSGTLSKKIVGLYNSVYRNGKGERKIVTSKFEPTYARQAFPCFDEPDMKAKYEVHLWKPNDPDYIALSNYPNASEENYNGGKLVHFQETVSMSTYLSCFIVCDFKCTTTSFKNGDNSPDIPFKVYASPQQLNKTEYAGKVGKDIIEYYVKYFGIPYPLPKLDMVAIPDFVSGAMEHWGLVTFRETALLYTSETHSCVNQQRVLSVIAHELAHSWFGNLVTMKWWDNLWLNEGFATYISYKGADSAEPTFGMLDQFITKDLHPVLNLDSKLSSHPIIKEVNTPDQITEVFDMISYNKGASVLRMLEGAVGHENFRRGVKNYLNKYAYGNALTHQLWDEIQAVTGADINITDFMDSFTVQMGYPIVDVSKEGNKYVLKQRRFLINPDDPSFVQSSPLGYKWTIPITYVTDKGKSKVFWFNSKNESFTIEIPSNTKWFKFNYDQVGYYRVNYTEDMLKTLTSHIMELSIADRTHLLEESFNLARAGELNYRVALNLTKYLEGETEGLPWAAASDALSGVFERLKDSVYEDDFKQYIIKIMKPVYNQLSWKVDQSENHMKRLGRIDILNLACKLGYPPALEEASNLLDKWIVTKKASQDLRSIIYKYGMKNANDEKWSKVYDTFVNETDSNERLKLLNGLAQVQNPTLLIKLLDLAKNESIVRGQDYFSCLRFIAMNPIGTSIVWDYVRENWEHIVHRFTLNDRYLGRLIPDIAGSFSTKTKLREMQDFFKLYPEAGAGAAARLTALENIRNNINWLEKYKPTIEEWISQNKLDK